MTGRASPPAPTYWWRAGLRPGSCGCRPPGGLAGEHVAASSTRGRSSTSASCAVLEGRGVLGPLGLGLQQPLVPGRAGGARSRWRRLRLLQSRSSLGATPWRGFHRTGLQCPGVLVTVSRPGSAQPGSGNPVELGRGGPRPCVRLLEQGVRWASEGSLGQRGEQCPRQCVPPSTALPAGLGRQVGARCKASGTGDVVPVPGLVAPGPLRGLLPNAACPRPCPSPAREPQAGTMCWRLAPSPGCPSPGRPGARRPEPSPLPWPEPPPSGP
nr:basic proline-rich protein-like [Dasypus novemcinctus]